MSEELTAPATYALDCVAAMVRGERPPDPPDEPLFRGRAACFVSLKKHGELRGCIGTLSPEEPDLGHEIVRNAFGAAFRDPRFPPVTPEEVGALSCSVDVLGEPEPCTLEDLDPARYGVIVAAGWKRGVLLPDLPGVDTVARQVGIALQKAGIGPDEPYDVERFTVRRYRGDDVAGADCGDTDCGEGCRREPSDGPRRTD